MQLLILYSPIPQQPLTSRNIRGSLIFDNSFSSNLNFSSPCSILYVYNRTGRLHNSLHFNKIVPSSTSTSFNNIALMSSTHSYQTLSLYFSSVEKMKIPQPRLVDNSGSSRTELILDSSSLPTDSVTGFSIVLVSHSALLLRVPWHPTPLDCDLRLYHNLYFRVGTYLAYATNRLSQSPC